MASTALATRTTFPWMTRSEPLARRTGPSPALSAAKKKVEELEAVRRKLQGLAKQNLGTGMGFLLTTAEVAAGGAASGAIDGAVARFGMPQWIATSARGVVAGLTVATGAFFLGPKTGKHLVAFGAGMVADVAGDTVRNLVLGKDA